MVAGLAARCVEDARWWCCCVKDDCGAWPELFCHSRLSGSIWVFVAFTLSCEIPRSLRHGYADYELHSQTAKDSLNFERIIYEFKRTYKLVGTTSGQLYQTNFHLSFRAGSLHQSRWVRLAENVAYGNNLFHVLLLMMMRSETHISSVWLQTILFVQSFIYFSVIHSWDVWDRELEKN